MQSLPVRWSRLLNIVFSKGFDYGIDGVSRVARNGNIRTKLPTPVSSQLAGGPAPDSTAQNSHRHHGRCFGMRFGKTQCRERGEALKPVTLC